MDAALALRWRRATLVASGIAAIELVLLVGAGVYFLGRGVSHQVRVQAAKVARPLAATRAQPRPRPAPRPAPARPLLPRSKTSVLVLNGNGVSGAASASAARLSSLGYVIGGVGDAPHPLARTTVMYAPGFRGEAARVAHDLNVRLVGPLDGLRPGQLMGARVAVVLGATS